MDKQDLIFSRFLNEGLAVAGIRGREETCSRNSDIRWLSANVKLPTGGPQPCKQLNKFHEHRKLGLAPGVSQTHQLCRSIYLVLAVQRGHSSVLDIVASNKDATRSKKLLGAPDLTTRNKKLLYRAKPSTLKTPRSQQWQAWHQFHLSQQPVSAPTTPQNSISSLEPLLTRHVSSQHCDLGTQLLFCLRSPPLTALRKSPSNGHAIVQMHCKRAHEDLHLKSKYVCVYIYIYQGFISE